MPAACRPTWITRGTPSSTSASPPRTSKKPSAPAEKSAPRSTATDVPALPEVVDVGVGADLGAEEWGGHHEVGAVRVFADRGERLGDVAAHEVHLQRASRSAWAAAEVHRSAGRP